MIYRFIIISDEVEDFMREVQIDADATFLDFHKAIISTCGYSDDQITSFTICENGWEKGQEITLEDMGKSADEDSYIMAKTRLSDFLEDEKQHLLYTFDPLADRVFFIELSEIIDSFTQFNHQHAAADIHADKIGTCAVIDLHGCTDGASFTGMHIRHEARRGITGKRLI
jgi:hypothetical protein